MSLKINKKKPEAPGRQMVAAERLWYTEDGQGLVPEGDPAAATLAVACGHRIAPDLVEKFGIVDGKLRKGKPADKRRKPGKNKGVKDG